jgi:hypothetical protein
MKNTQLHKCSKRSNPLKDFKRFTWFKIFILTLSLGLMLTLLGCTSDEDDSIAVTSVTLTTEGSQSPITTYAGTLQMFAMVTGRIYAADYQGDTQAYMTTAIADVLIGYQDGLGRAPDYKELHTGILGGKTLTCGVYQWSNDVLIQTDLTLHGSPTDVLIFQIAGTLVMAADIEIILTGGLLPENIVWVVANTVALGAGAHLQGIILSMTNVSMNTGSRLTGMIYAQTSVSLDAVIITKQ